MKSHDVIPDIEIAHDDARLEALMLGMIPRVERRLCARLLVRSSQGEELSYNSLLMLLLSSELMARLIEVAPSLTHGSSRVAMPGGLEMLMALCKC